MAGRAAAGFAGFRPAESVLLALLLRTVSHDHQLEGNDRQQCITYEEQRKLNQRWWTPFVMWSLHCKLSTVF